MVRAGDIFYPSHFPTRMADSLGVERTGFTGQTNGRSSADNRIDSENETTQAKREIEETIPANVEGPGSAEVRDDTRQDRSEDVWPRPRLSGVSAVREEARSTSWVPGANKRKFRSDSG